MKIDISNLSLSEALDTAMYLMDITQLGSFSFKRTGNRVYLAC